MKMAIVAAVITHFALAVWHALSHQMVPVPLTAAQTAFVLVFVMMLPLVGAGLLFTRFRISGALVVGTAMLASLVFGVCYHFVINSPDNVAAVPQGHWHAPFVASAIVLAMSEAVGAIVAFAALHRERAGRANRLG